MANEAKKRTKRSDQDDPQGLEVHIASKRKELLEARAQVPAMRERVAELRAAMALPARQWEYRRRQDTLREADALEAEANIRASMIREYEFEASVTAYLRTYHQRVKGQGSGVAAFVNGADATRQRQDSIVDEFLIENHRAPPRVAMAARDECPRCKMPLLLLAAKSIMTCSQCGYAITYLDATSSCTSFDEVIDFSSYSYKRINHYTMHLSLVQGKEAHRVPDDIMRSVVAELHPHHSLEQVTLPLIRKTLRRLRLRKAYDHAVQIHARLTGTSPPRITPEDEERMKTMFLQMQPAFQKCAPGNRTNFLSYSYVMYRCFQILGLHHMLPSVVLLRGRDKLEANDAIFGLMSKDLGWPIFDLPPPEGGEEEGEQDGMEDA